MAIRTHTTSPAPEFPDIPTPAALLAIVDRIAADFIIRPGIDPGSLNTAHPAWAAIRVELDREFPHRSVAVDFSCCRFFRGVWYIGMEREDDDDARHVVSGIADDFFEDRAMSKPAQSIRELCARLDHAAAMVIEGGFCDGTAEMIGFFEIIRADCLNLLRDAAAR